jgi:hypothetical protein
MGGDREDRQCQNRLNARLLGAPRSTAAAPDVSTVTYPLMPRLRDCGEANIAPAVDNLWVSQGAVFQIGLRTPLLYG